MSAGGARASRGSRRRQSEGSTRFQAERRALGKIQVHFEFQQALMHKIRIAAAAENLSYADYVRKLVGLPYAKIQRPRISLSFGTEDLERLAGRYGRPGADPQALKRCVMDEISSQLDAADLPDDR